MRRPNLRGARCGPPRRCAIRRGWTMRVVAAAHSCSSELQQPGGATGQSAQGATGQSAQDRQGKTFSLFPMQFLAQLFQFFCQSLWKLRKYLIAVALFCIGKGSCLAPDAHLDGRLACCQRTLVGDPCSEVCRQTTWVEIRG
jgi:hypothetical protein